MVKQFGELEQKEYKRIDINGVTFNKVKVQNLGINCIIIGFDKFGDIIKGIYNVYKCCCVFEN
jgi:hypothetical protein